MTNTQIVLDKCAPFISSTAYAAIPQAPSRHQLAITISRQSGSGAHAIAELLADYLQARGPDKTRSWQVFDRNLVEKVLEDHHLPTRYARFMPEDRVSELGGAI